MNAYKKIPNTNCEVPVYWQGFKVLCQPFDIAKRQRNAMLITCLKHKVLGGAR